MITVEHPDGRSAAVLEFHARRKVVRCQGYAAGGG